MPKAIVKSSAKKMATYRLRSEVIDMIEEIIKIYKEKGDKIYKVDVIEAGVKRVYDETTRGEI